MKSKRSRKGTSAAGGQETIEDQDFGGLGSLRIEMVRFGVNVLPRLRAMEFERRKAALAECSEHSLREPLQYHHKRDLKVLALSSTERFDGAQIIAMMAFGLFVQMQENVQSCGSLIEMFPEIEAAVRVDRRRTQVEALRAELEESIGVAAEAPLLAGVTGSEPVLQV